MIDAVRADVIPDNDAVVVNRSHFRCQGAGPVNRGEDALVVDKSVRVAQSVVVPSRHLAAVVDAERNRVEGARRLDMAEDAINAHHGMRETARLIGGKPGHVSLRVDPVKPGSERAGKAHVSEDAILPDKPVRGGAPFGGDAAVSTGLPRVVHLEEGGAVEAGKVNGVRTFPTTMKP